MHILKQFTALHPPGIGDAELGLRAATAAAAILLLLLEPLVLLGLALRPYRDGCGVSGDGDGGSEGECSCSKSAVSGAGGTGVACFLSSVAAVVVEEEEATFRCRSRITWLWRRAYLWLGRLSN